MEGTISTENTSPTPDELISVDLEKAKQVEDIKIKLQRESGKSGHYKEYQIEIKGQPAGSFAVSYEDEIPRVEAANIIDPRYRGKGYGSAAYMSFSLGCDTDIQRGSTNAFSSKVWASLSRRHLVDNNILKVARVRQHLGIKDH